MPTSSRQAVFYTAAGTLIGVSISYLVTQLALEWAGVPFLPVAKWLSIGLPATLAPLTMYPLLLMNQRQRRMRMELEQLVRTDMLTGLPNRRAFFEFAKELMAGATPPGTLLTAMMIDIDHFKPINDTYGHDAGDHVLRRIATTIRDVVAGAGADDWGVARLGGEEFVVLVSGLIPAGVAQLADAICHEVRGLDHEPINASRATVSIGVAFRAPGMSIDRLLKLADDAVYAAKHGGRDRWSFGSLDKAASRTRGRTQPEPANDRAAAG
jgi:diguanylate cyclase (GGDEF)-like protein